MDKLWKRTNNSKKVMNQSWAFNKSWTCRKPNHFHELFIPIIQLLIWSLQIHNLFTIYFISLTSHEQAIYKSFTTSEQIMNKSRTNGEQVVNNSWKSQEKKLTIHVVMCERWKSARAFPRLITCWFVFHNILFWFLSYQILAPLKWNTVNTKYWQFFSNCILV